MASKRSKTNLLLQILTTVLVLGLGCTLGYFYAKLFVAEAPPQHAMHSMHSMHAVHSMPMMVERATATPPMEQQVAVENRVTEASTAATPVVGTPKQNTISATATPPAKPELPVQQSAEVAAPPPKIGGVAMAILLHSPKWFQRRYTMMANNIDDNIPPDWKIQIFFTDSGGSQVGIDLNPGLQKLVKRGRLVLTLIPPDLLRRKKRRIELMTDKWIWESVLSDTVLVFGGNSVICTNSPQQLTDYASKFDYIGTPWRSAKEGVGGDGGISIRNRIVMLEVIQYKLNQVASGPARDTAYQSWGMEDIFFVHTMLEMNKARAVTGHVLYRIASREETLRFGASEGYAHDEALVVSGTLAPLDWKARDTFINYCIELKMIYPVLHEPACFGAAPNAAQCASSICALKNRTERKGGC